MNFIEKPDDLSHLTHIKADALKAFVEEIKNAECHPEKKLVVALGTGGTIAMRIENGKWIPDLNFENILKYTSAHLRNKFEIKGFDLFNMDSSQMDYSHIRDLAIVITYIWNNLDIDFAGFLVLHGTDTMTYSAASLSLMMGQGMPFSIVYTGAQKPIQELINDAVANLYNSLFTLDSLHQKDMAEVVIVVGDRAVLGTSSEKVNESSVDAFDAPLHKYVADFNKPDYPVPLAKWLNKKRDVKFEPRIWDGDFSHTLIVKSHLGLSPDMVKTQVQDPNIKAIILYTYGGNTVYEPIVDVVMAVAEQRNLAVFVVSPVNAEPKATYMSGHYMFDKGAVPLFMTLSAALAKLEIALRLYPEQPRKIAEFMTVNYVGEIPFEKSRFIETR